MVTKGQIATSASPPRNDRGEGVTTEYACFSVRGKAQGKARPRVVQGHAYTPAATRKYEEMIRESYRAQCVGKQFADDAGLWLFVFVSMAAPKSDNKKTREAKLRNELLPIKKPDGDNIWKVVADSLNGVAYHDDCQIVSGTVEKYYGPEDGIFVMLCTRRKDYAQVRAVWLQMFEQIYDVKGACECF